MTTLPLKQIIPDAEQPRKFFDATKMHSLKESIKKLGIMVPLTVEDMGSGKYLLIDGERRFRAAVELKLTEVPVIIEKPTTAIERLVKQFNVQEMHEAWTPIEKAEALINLSKEMGLTIMAVCKLLNIPESIIRKYVAFSELANKEAYVRNEIPLDYADQIKWSKNTIRQLKEKEGKEFLHSDEKKFEARVIQNIKDGVIIRRNDITKLKDAFTKSPKLIEEYITNNDATPLKMFFKAGGQGAYFLRNTISNARYMSSNARKFLEKKDVAISPDQLSVLKTAKKQLEMMIALVE